MSRKGHETVQKLLQLAKPTFVNDRWRKPVLSGRKVAVLRKSMVLEGYDWPAKPLRNRGGDKPLKLSKRERGRDARQQMIEEKMKTMPEMVAEYRKNREELREKTRKAKQRSEEDTYLIATGKKQQEEHWKIFKDKKR